MVSGDGASGEVIRTRWGHEGGALTNGISALTGVLGAGFPLCSLPREDTSEVSSLHPGKRVLTRT